MFYGLKINIWTLIESPEYRELINKTLITQGVIREPLSLKQMVAHYLLEISSRQGVQSSLIFLFLIVLGMSLNVLTVGGFQIWLGGVVVFLATLQTQQLPLFLKKELLKILFILVNDYYHVYYLKKKMVVQLPSPSSIRGGAKQESITSSVDPIFLLIPLTRRYSEPRTTVLNRLKNSIKLPQNPVIVYVYIVLAVLTIRSSDFCKTHPNNSTNFFVGETLWCFRGRGNKWIFSPDYCWG